MPRFLADLGTAPIVNYVLEMGSYHLRLSKPGFHDFIYQVFIERCMHWDGRDHKVARTKIKMFPIGTWTDNDCYVPAGWFWLACIPNRRSLCRDAAVG